MVSSTKDRLSKLRENRKKDPVKYAEYLCKERERDAIRRKRKKEELCTEDLKMKHRLKVRERVRAHRERKKNNANVNCDSPIGSYNCLQTFSKAVKKVKKYLPVSPTKKAAVIQKVITDVLGGSYEIKSSEFFNNKGPKLSIETQRAVRDFFYRDDVSRQAPGRKDCKTVRDPETGVKVKKQKRTMITTISETYEYFKDLNPDINIGKSYFYNLRQTEVLPISDTPHNVCVCTLHANFINLFESLKKEIPLPETHKKLIEMISCDITNENCMAGSCDKCPKNWSSFDTTLVGAKQVSWNQRSSLNNRPEIIKKTTTCDEALNELKNMSDKFRLHYYIKQVQSDHFESRRQNLSKHEAVIQIDFAENYALVHQDEIQSAHWSHKQVTIFTCCIWFANKETKPIAIISNDTSHTKQAVWTFLKKIVDYIQAIRSDPIASFIIFSDNCAAQFKNKYTLSSLHELKNRGNAKQLQWHFFAASHGKGAVDGIGGTIKRLAWLGVKSRQIILNSAADFYAYVKTQTQAIHVMYIEKEDIETDTQFLKELWDDVQAIPDLRKQHYFEVLDYRRLIVAKTSKSSSVQVVVTKQEIWEDEYLVPLAVLKTTHEEELEEVSDVTSDSNPALTSASVPDFQVAECSKRRLRYSEVYTDSEEDEPHPDGSVQNIKLGTFVLVKFQLKGKKKTEYRYAGICQSSTSDDDGEIKIMFLKVVGDNASTFRPDNKDVSYVRYEDIISVLPRPTSYVENDSTYYEFATKLDVFEK